MTVDLLTSVRSLEARVATLEETSSRPACATEGVVSTLSVLIERTRELFDAEVGLEVDRDPESPEDTWLVFSVRASEGPRELLAKRQRWHEAVAAIAPDEAHRLRLSILPVE